ncbi:hypothetical protein IJT17_03885 [bacterium]|nr:hypothetical protein [bacterium]
MKLRLLPVMASLCGMLFCASAAQANSVYVHNKPIENVLTVNNTVYVPFNDLMKGLGRSWSVDESGKIILKDFAGAGPDLKSADIVFGGELEGSGVKGMMHGGQVWVPVRMVRMLGYELSYNAKTEIVDIVTPRMKTDADRAAEAEVNQARAEREAKLAEEREAERAALEERKQAMAELKAKRNRGEDGSPSASEAEANPAEGSYDEGFEVDEEAAARRVAAKQKDIGGVESYDDLVRVQQQLDEQDAARRAARREAQKRAAEAEEANGGVAADKAAEPAPNVVVFAPRANPDYFTGHIDMTAIVKNIGNLAAQGVSATLTLVAPDGSVLNTQRVNRQSVPVNGQWEITAGYDHIDGTSMPRGNYQLRVAADCTNKPKK